MNEHVALRLSTMTKISISLKDGIGRLRLTGFLEAISWLLLLFIAMPLKYFADQPLMVKYVGWVHGILFMLYVGQLLYFKFKRNWKILFSLKGLLASLLPFGTIWFDRYLQKEEFSSSENKKGTKT